MQAIIVRSLIVAAVSVAAAAAVTVAASGYARNLSLAPDDSPAPASLFTPDGPQEAPQFRGVDVDELSYGFYFTRAMYSSGGWGRRGGGRWATDYPQADLWIAMVLRRLTGIDVSPNANTVALDDPELRRFPFLYALEVGSMSLREEEREGLRNYLLAGGFLMIDDFWGSSEWYNFEREIRAVLPEYEIVELPLDHEIFSTFYQVEEIVQVPNVNQGVYGGPTHERDGYVPHCLGIFDDEGRLMVVINWNTDLGDAWEWAELAEYPLTYSTYAYQMAANFIVYAMTH